MFVIIIDQKVPPRTKAPFKAAMAGRPDVHMVEDISINWGRFSVTEANIRGLQVLFDRDVQFDYVFSISGQDYPLVGAANLHRVLKEAKGFSFLEHYPFPVEAWIDGGIGRIYSWNIFLPGRRVVQIPKATVTRRRALGLIYRFLGVFVPRRGPLPNGMRPFGGSMHWILSREAAAYVQDFLRSHPDYTRRFRFTLISDEIFFQTILANSRLCTKLINSDQRYLRWSQKDAPSPEVLTMKDLPVIRKCGMLFARKFDSQVDPSILDAIDTLAGTHTSRFPEVKAGSVDLLP